jgi:uncharacterized protein YktA (UPF0223 family)
VINTVPRSCADNSDLLKQNFESKGDRRVGKCKVLRKTLLQVWRKFKPIVQGRSENEQVE